MPSQIPLCSQRGFAALMPIGPKSVDVARAVALITSLLQWEPDVRWFVTVDDAPTLRGITELNLFPPTCRAHSMLNPRNGRGSGWTGGLSAGMLAGLGWIHEHTDADFVLKVDTDALVIAPFAERVRAFLAAHPEAGIIGTLGISCNPTIRATQALDIEPFLLRTARLLPPLPLDVDPVSVAPLEIDTIGRITGPKRQAFDRVRPHVEAAHRNGYVSSEYCQGGAYAMARVMVDRMADAGYLRHPEVWAEFPFGEDTSLAMYARAVGLQVVDCSAPGQPFGVQFSGLAYPPEELVRRGHALIHSVKGDRRLSETAIREFFRSRLEHALP